MHCVSLTYLIAEKALFITVYKSKCKVSSFPGERKFKCDKCEKAFFTNYALQKHLVKHSAVKNYKCDQCTAEFFEKVSLKRYTNIKTNAKTRFL